AVGFEIDSRQVPGPRAEGKLNIVANAGQTLTVRIGVELRGAPRARERQRRASSGLLQPLVTMAMAFFLVRLVRVPLVDFIARDGGARAAAARAAIPVDVDSPLHRPGGWLALPWNRLLLANDPVLPLSILNPGVPDFQPVPAAEFRHYLIS